MERAQRTLRTTTAGRWGSRGWRGGWGLRGGGVAFQEVSRPQTLSAVAEFSPECDGRIKAVLCYQPNVSVSISISISTVAVIIVVVTLIIIVVVVVVSIINFAN